MNKKVICLLSVVLLLVGMSCSCNLMKLLLGNAENDILVELESELVQELTEMEEIEEEVVAQVEEQLTEDGPSPLQHAGEEVEEITESIQEELETESTDSLSPEEMGSQPNWSIVVTGCEEYFEEGEDSGFYPSADREEIEFIGEFHRIILTMTKDWKDETLWFVDYTDNDVTNDLIDFVIYDYTNDTYVFLPDWLTYYWEYEEDEQHIFGIIDFDARAYDSIENTEIFPECMITGQFAFDNISVP